MNRKKDMTGKEEMKSKVNRKGNRKRNMAMYRAFREEKLINSGNLLKPNCLHD